MGRPLAVRKQSQASFEPAVRATIRTISGASHAEPHVLGVGVVLDSKGCKCDHGRTLYRLVHNTVCEHGFLCFLSKCG